MPRPFKPILFLLFFTAAANAQVVQQNAPELGKPIERDLAGGETHSYAISLAQGQYAHAVVTQRGIDVVVVFRGPDGRKIVELDTPTDDVGPEPISLLAESAGTYVLEVTSLNKSAHPGHYSLKLEALRTATPQDKSYFAAQKSFTEAKPLRNQRTRESYRKAIEKYQESLAVWQALNDTHMKAYTLTEMALIYGDIGEYQKGLDAYAQARPLYNALGDWKSAASMDSNTAWIYNELGEHQKALDLYLKVEETHRAKDKSYVDVVLLSSIGATYAKMGQYQTALDIHLRVLPMRRASGSLGGQALTLNNIGSCYQSLGDNTKALDYYLQALNLMPNLGNPFYTAATLNHIGVVYRSLGQHEKAIDYFNQALVLRQTIGDQNGEAATQSDLARLERDRGNFLEARKRVEAALATIESLRLKVGSPHLRSTLVASAQRYREFYIALLMRMHEQHPSDHFDVAAFQASETGRARSLLELLAEANAEIREGVDTSLLQRERTLHDTISDVADRRDRLFKSRHTTEEATAITRELAALTDEYEQVETRIRQTSPRYAALTQPVPLTLDEIQQRVLDANTVLLEYSLGEERSFVWAVTPSSVKSYELSPRATIEPLARRVYDLLTTRDPQYTEASAQLSRILLSPVAADLKDKRLLIVGDGVLQYVPFAALPSPGGPNPLIVDHEIVTAPSAAVVAVLRQEMTNHRAADKTLAVFADPVFSINDPRVAPSQNRSGLQDLRRLRFTRQEADDITRLVNGDSKLAAVDFAANRTLATSPEIGRYRIVHFATHGLINTEHPELSGVVLSLVDEKGRPQNGFLRLYDLYNLKLSAELVVLSACQTALGRDIKGEGLVGLTRGFMYAGAPRVVASLWQVEDRASAEVMKRFYEAMFVQKLTPSAALRAAQVSMSADKRWHAPYYWAAFTLQGEWR
ncbi:MAG TPA: CHAT domain-containing tetratricopeptide repeat protein [Pyrinomonadaceae bacterium]|nr:CHAT domain-containing tetratricopeptide repeat protein [Pyrinomonadaceae bacterium]